MIQSDRIEGINPLNMTHKEATVVVENLAHAVYEEDVEDVMELSLALFTWAAQQ